MIAVSDAWKNIQYRFLLPETFVEISVGVTDVGVHDLITATGTNEAVFSNVSEIVNNPTTDVSKKYATLEHNLWALDGTRDLTPDSAPYVSAGYVSQDTSVASVELTLPEVRTVPIPGFTITWSSEYGEYPTSFAVIVKNGDTIVADTYVGDNASSVSEVSLEVTNYDSVTVEVYDWCLPYHRARIDLISFGHVLVFTKKNIMSFTHEQFGSLNSSEISKNSIEFTLDNTDGRWNPNNPSGLEQYLSERQIVTVRYGMDVDGTTEWIKAGTFYLSEWRAPSNGLEATFAARDIFEYLLNEPYKGRTTGTLLQMVNDALSSADVPDTLKVVIDSSLSNYTATLEQEYTAAEVVQMCANAACCVMYQNRDGELHIEPLNQIQTDYVISSALSYSHPEVTLSKPMKDVSVSYGEDLTYILNANLSGETQTVDNPMVNTAEQAAEIAAWVWRILKSRKTVSGEFRADPRLDLFDLVSVESKYGVIMPVAITNIKYVYSGSFQASYTGVVLPEINVSSVLGEFILGLSELSEGV